MLEARSVAVVGASARPGSFGEQMMVQLARGGFGGAIYPVNPRYGEILGYPCWPSIDQVPEPVDLVILGVPNASLESQLETAASAGARSAVIFASCYEPPVAGTLPLGDRLAAIAREAGMALCGGNGMGFINIEYRLRACGFYEPEHLEPGPIALITHSGSVFSALLHNDRGLRFNLAVSSGLELVTTAAEYISYALSKERTRAIALFIETARKPEEFRSALAGAAELDVPVVALKVGRAAQAKEWVVAHSGALAGEAGAYEAVFDAYGVLAVDTLDEMTDTLELFVAGRRAAPGGLAALHDSGGERAHLIDMAEASGLPLARISAHTKSRLAAVLDEGLAPANPLDAWGTGNEADPVFVECIKALMDDPDTGALAFCVDLTTEPAPDSGFKQVARDAFVATSKPMAVLSNLATAIDPTDARYVREAGVPILEGTISGLAAFGHLFDYRDRRSLPAVIRAEPSPAPVRDRWIERLGERQSLDEVEGLSLLADYGIPAVRAERAATERSVVDAAHRVGWPVALKTRAPGVAHKSDAGGVILPLASEGALRDAYRELSARLGPEVTVARTAPPGVELALGVVSDEQFGPLIVVAAGGTLVEVLRDRRFLLPPVDVPRALAAMDRLAIRPLLRGVRGRPAADVDAVARAVVRLSVMAVELGDHLAAVDANPVVCGPEGCVAVDALVIPRPSP